MDSLVYLIYQTQNPDELMLKSLWEPPTVVLCCQKEQFSAGEKMNQASLETAQTHPQAHPFKLKA